MSMPNVRLRELSGHVGDRLGPSEWHQMTQERIDGFADATDDWQWIHVDPQRAAAGPFGTTIAHGYLTLSLIPRLLGSALTISDQTRGANYGIESLRFTAPVRSADRVRLVGELAAVTERSDGGVLYQVDGSVEIEGGRKPALVGRFLYLAYADEE